MVLLLAKVGESVCRACLLQLKRGERSAERGSICKDGERIMTTFTTSVQILMHHLRGTRKLSDDAANICRANASGPKWRRQIVWPASKKGWAYCGHPCEVNKWDISERKCGAFWWNFNSVNQNTWWHSLSMW